MHVDQGGISRLVQLNKKGGSHGTPRGLQEEVSIIYTIALNVGI